MKIADIRDPALFQRLVQRLYIALRGYAFQVVDDSGGDAGNDGYDPQTRVLLSIYCPEKPDSADFLRKGKADLEKAVALATRPAYSISDWWFVTPMALREPVQAALRSLAIDAGLTASFLADSHLEDLYLRHSHLRDAFPELEYPRVAETLAEILQAVRPQSSEPLQQPHDANVDPPSPAASNRTMLGLVSARLADLALRLDNGDATAVPELERLRMESLDPREILASLIIELQYSQDVGDRQRATQLALDGLVRARKQALAGEQAIFAINYAFEKTLDLVRRDMEMVGVAVMSNSAGMPLLSPEVFFANQRGIEGTAREVDELVREAQKASEASGDLLSLYLVLLRRGTILAQRHFPFALSLSMGTATNAADTIRALKREMELVYEGAVRAASALRSDQRLATAYGNFANDLVAFGDYERGEAHARHALQVAERAGDSQQIAKTSLLLAKIARERLSSSAPVNGRGHR